MKKQGIKKLIKFMRDMEINDTALAKKLKVSQATIYTWKHGVVTPGVGAAIRLDRLSKGYVSVYDWE